MRKPNLSELLAGPPAFLEQLQLQASASVGLQVKQGCLVVTPTLRPHYTMAELLAASDYSNPQAQAAREWLDAPSVGSEIL